MSENKPPVTGWICPVCGRGMSPDSMSCPCVEQKSTLTLTEIGGSLCQNCGYVIWPNTTHVCQVNWTINSQPELPI